MTPRQTGSTSKDLFASLYDELHRLAESHLRRRGRELTISPTTLIHEAWLDLSKRERLEFPDRARFLAYAARAMRGIVIDHVRQSRAQKRGGDAVQITLPPELALSVDDERSIEELARLSDALDELATVAPTLAELVDLHFFCGYSFAEVAEMRGVSERTVQREWRKARLLLHRSVLDDDARITPDTSPPPMGDPSPRTD
jgi:RNA polymerase sigma factor (TIGR02999 family)